MPLTTLQCLRALWTGDDADAQRVRKGIAETRAGAAAQGPAGAWCIHGSDDGLIPPAFSSAPYVKQAQAAGRDVRYWQVRNAQHFDAFLGLPDYGARYLPMLPYVYAALDRCRATPRRRRGLAGRRRDRNDATRRGKALDGVEPGDAALRRPRSSERDGRPRHGEGACSRARGSALAAFTRRLWHAGRP